MRPCKTYSATRRKALGWLRTKAKLYAMYSTGDLEVTLWLVAKAEDLPVTQDEVRQIARDALAREAPSQS